MLLVFGLCGGGSGTRLSRAGFWSPGDVGARAGRMDSAWATAWEGGGRESVGGMGERGGRWGVGGGAFTGRLTFEKMAY